MLDITPQGRRYDFVVNNMRFTCTTDYREDLGVNPHQILIADLEQVLRELKSQPDLKVGEFKLPPLKPKEK